MPRMRRSAAVKETIIGGGAASGAVPPAATASGFSSMEGIDHIVNGINLRRRDVMLLKTARTWALLATVIAGCAFGSGWAHAPRKHLVKGKDVGVQEAPSSGSADDVKSPL